MARFEKVIDILKTDKIAEQICSVTCNSTEATGFYHMHIWNFTLSLPVRVSQEFARQFVFFLSLTRQRNTSIQPHHKLFGNLVPLLWRNAMQTTKRFAYVSERKWGARRTCSIFQIRILPFIFSKCSNLDFIFIGLRSWRLSFKCNATAYHNFTFGLINLKGIRIYALVWRA